MIHSLTMKPYPKSGEGLEHSMHLIANVDICLTLSPGQQGYGWATVLLYLSIWNLGRTWAVCKPASDMVLRTQEIKASIKECSMKNLVTTWIESAVREKQRSAGEKSCLFTVANQGDWNCRSRVYHLCVRFKVSKLIR